MIFSLQISTKTWLKESCELIDYDSEILIPTIINIKKTSYIYREENEIIALDENITNDDDKEKLMKINVYNNYKDIFFEFERNKYELDEIDNIITPNTSWFLLKPSKMDPKMNRYKINSGEIIKIGRITMRIRDIIFSDKKKNNNNATSLNESNASNYNIKEMKAMKTEGIQNNNTLDNINYNKNKRNKDIDTKSLEPSEKIINVSKKKLLKKNYSIFSKVEKKNKVCRICYIEEEDALINPLMQPCICDGSLKFIHYSCLKQWISTHSCVKLDENENCSIFLIKPVECELCKTKFPDFIKYQNKLYPLLDFSNQYQNYLTLESLTLDKNKNKFIYVVSLEKNKKIKIGRGHECEILLSDISISRIHSHLIIENKKVFLEDNDSKFGTLVFIQNPKLKLSQDLPLFIQIGRTSIELKIKKDFKLFSCCDIEEKNSIFYYYNQNEKYIKDNMGLNVKDDESENDDAVYYKNNNSQEFNENTKFHNNSINIKEKDKMSDNEYLLIKHNKRNKDIIKNIFYDETIEKDYNQNNGENNNETNSKENNNNSQEKNQNDAKRKESESIVVSNNREENETNNNNENNNLIDNNNNTEENLNNSINTSSQIRENNNNDSTIGN